MPKNKLSTLNAQDRDEFGKGAARRLRRDGRVPAVVYGQDEDPTHVSVDILELTALVRNHGVNTVINLAVDGKETLVMIKAIDQNVLTLNIDHADFMNVKRGEKVSVEVPVIVEGESISGSLAVLETPTLAVLADVLSIPEEFITDVEGLEIGSQILAADLTMPEGVELETEADQLIVNIVNGEDTSEEETAAEEGEAEEEGSSEESSSSEEE